MGETKDKTEKKPDDILQENFSKIETMLALAEEDKSWFGSKEGDLVLYDAVNEAKVELKNELDQLKADGNVNKLFDKERGLPKFIDRSEEIKKRIDKLNSWLQDSEVMKQREVLQALEKTSRQKVEVLSGEWNTAVDATIDKLTRISKVEHIDEAKYNELLFQKADLSEELGSEHMVDKLLVLENKIKSILDRYPDINTPLGDEMAKKNAKMAELQNLIAQNIARERIKRIKPAA